MKQYYIYHRKGVFMQRNMLVRLSVLLCVCLFACSSDRFIPQKGDLVFCVATSSEYSDAIVEATASADSLRYDHVGIVTIENDNVFIIEASSCHGVVMTAWDDFVAKSPGVVVMRVIEDFPIDDAIHQAKSHIGEEYDWAYMPDNGKMYCSELVYECYRRENGTPLFNTAPMCFRNANGEIPKFWVDLYQSLGMPIPEGKHGTNPSDMSKSSILEEVYRSF